MAMNGFVRKFKPLEILTEEQIRAIHLATLDLLETTGVRMEHDGGLKLLEKHGCKVSVLQLGLPDRFIDQGDPALQLASVGLDAAGIAHSIRMRLSGKPQ